MRMHIHATLYSKTCVKRPLSKDQKLVFKACYTWPSSAVGNMSGNRCESDCRSRGREFDPGLVPYFRGD